MDFIGCSALFMADLKRFIVLIYDSRCKKDDSDYLTNQKNPNLVRGNLPENCSWKEA